jgi:hypothetical protein
MRCEIWGCKGDNNAVICIVIITFQDVTPCIMEEIHVFKIVHTMYILTGTTRITTKLYSILKCDVTLKHVGSFIKFVTLYFNVVYVLVVIHVIINSCT